MTAVDAPPGLPFGGQAAGEFVARPGSRRLAARVLAVVLLLAVATVWAARRRLLRHAELAFAVPLVSLAIAGVGYAVRRAHLRIDHDGVRWGWEVLGFRMSRRRLERALSYRDAVAFQPRRGSLWYLARRDWDRFERIPAALARAGIPFESRDRDAPLRSRLQSYGLVLDLLLVADAIAAVISFVLAVS